VFWVLFLVVSLQTNYLGTGGEWSFLSCAYFERDTHSLHWLFIATAD
jgi:hypothetical protein